MATLVSVIVPTYNSAETLEACLKSIQAQTYKTFELIVVDNNSSDATRDVARQYTSNLFIAGPERSAQRNRAAERAKGELLVFIDSDMQLKPKVLEQAVELFQDSQNIVSAVIPEETIGKGYWAAVRWFERSFYVGVDWIEAARIFRTKTFNKAGGYNEDLISGEDWDLAQRVAEHGKTGRITTKVLHDENNLRLVTHLKKKYYYSQHLAAYSGEHEQVSGKQFGLISRMRLFLAKPLQLLKRPDLAIGLFLMKFLEFVVYLYARLRLRFK